MAGVPLCCQLKSAPHSQYVIVTSPRPNNLQRERHAVAVKTAGKVQRRVASHRGRHPQGWRMDEAEAVRSGLERRSRSGVARSDQQVEVVEQAIHLDRELGALAQRLDVVGGGEIAAEQEPVPSNPAIQRGVGPKLR